MTTRDKGGALSAAVLGFVAASCKQPPPVPQPVASASAVVSTTAPVVASAPPPAVSSAPIAATSLPELTAADVTTKALAGTVAGKGVHMNLYASGDNVIGFYTYDGNSSELDLRGTFKAGVLTLTEAISANVVTGSFHGELAANSRSIEGTWTKGKAAPSVPFSLHALTSHTGGPDTAPLHGISLAFQSKSDVDLRASLIILDDIPAKDVLADLRRALDPRGYVDFEVPPEKTAVSLASLLTAQDGTVTSIDTTVNCNAHGVFDVTMLVATMGAYPSVNVTQRTLSLVTGAIIQSGDFLLPDARAQLATSLGKKMRADVSKTLADNKKEFQEVPDFAKQLREMVFSPKELDSFMVTPKGVTFLVDFDFPHAFKALQPRGAYEMTFRELAPFLKPASPLAALAALAAAVP